MKYIHEYITGPGTCNGYQLKFRINGGYYYKIFKFSDYTDPLASAKYFRDNDPEVKKLLTEKSRQMKSRLLTLEESFSYYMKKLKIKTFPVIKFGVKLIGIDKIDRNFVFIKECALCKKHVNVLVYKKNLGTEYCNSCLNSLKRKDFVYEYPKLTRGIEYIRIGTEISLCINLKRKILFSSEINLRVPASENILKNYREYFKYVLYKFINENKLKYELPLDKKTFNKLDSFIKNGNFIPKVPNIKINLDLLRELRIKKFQHIFTAKIQGFGTNKRDESKTVLLNEVEYVGIDNFRDHMWTQFTKELDLPIGTTIKFKGEIYDYEREYLGTREVDKNGQAIKIIDLLEVDLSTRERVKLYK